MGGRFTVQDDGTRAVCTGIDCLDGVGGLKRTGIVGRVTGDTSDRRGIQSNGIFGHNLCQVTCYVYGL